MAKLLSIFLFVFSLLCLCSSAFAKNYGWTNIGQGLCSVSSSCAGSSYTDFSDISCTSEDECWVSSSCVNEIYHTTDGGKTWQVQHTDYRINAIVMRDSLNGYAGGEYGRIYRTTDGGSTWTAIGATGKTITDIECPPSGDTCYASGFNGNIWSIRVSTVSKMDSGVNSDLLGLSFPINSDEGWVVGGSIISHYTRGTWLGDSSYPYGGYNAIEMLNTSEGWAVGDSGLMIHTTDGKNWSSVTNPDTKGRTLNDVFFLNANEGWTVGVSGAVIHTTDGGANWQVMADGLADTMLRRVFFTSSTNGYVAGNKCTLLKYTEVTEFLLGDVNGDGNINIVDALLVARHAVGLEVSPFNAAAADINCDGRIDIVDALLIARKTVGLEVPAWGICQI